MRKFFTLIFAVMFAGQAWADDFTIGNLKYTITDAEKHEVSVGKISDNNKPEGDLVIPAEVENEGVKYAVTSIGEGAFKYCDNLTSVTIPNSVKSIGDLAFVDCSKLESITIPNSVTQIGLWAFLWCSGLTSVTILNSVTTIGDEAFDGCSSLTYNEYDNSYYLGNDDNPYLWLIKAKSTDITSCEINENCKYIYNDAFSSCSRLTSITIPNSVKNIGKHPFYGCSSMQSITLPYVFEHHIGYMFDGCDFDISVDEPVDGNPNVLTTRSYSIPSTLKSITVNGGKIPYEAFCKCNNLTSLTITESVTSIDEFAFYGCTIDTLTYNTKAFSELSGVIQTVIIGDSITEIADQAFWGMKSLTSIIIPNSVTKIGKNAFAYCENLKYNVYDNANYLGNDDNPYLVLVAAKDKDIKSCDINFRCRFIYDGAFYGCKQLSEILIPDLVSNFSGYAFARCDNLTSINVESGNINYSSENGDVYSKDKKNLICVPAGKTGEYTVSNSVDSICGYSFSGSNLTSVTIPFGVKSIASYAFYYCEKLNVLTIPMGVGFIDGYAIWECKNLTIYCEETSRPKGWSEYWNDYHKIVWGYKPTTVTETSANVVNIYTHGNTVVVENATDEISVYDAMGRLVARRDDVHIVSTNEIRVNNPGLYIVKVGNEAKRVMVNN